MSVLNQLKALLYPLGSLSHRLRIVVIVVGILVIIGSGGYWYYSQSSSKSDSGTDDASQLQQNVTNLITEKKFDEAQAILETSESKETLSELQLAATVAVGKNDYAQALSIYQKIESTYGINESLAINIAQAAQFSGDKAKAVQYYQKAIDILKQQPTDSIIENQIIQLQTLLKEVGQ